MCGSRKNPCGVHSAAAGTRVVVVAVDVVTVVVVVFVDVVTVVVVAKKVVVVVRHTPQARRS